MPLLFQYMKNQKKIEEYQQRFDKSQTLDPESPEKELEIKHSIYKDFPRVMFGELQKNIYINNKQIVISPKYIDEFRAYNAQKKTVEQAEDIENNFQFIQRLFKEILKENGIPVENLDPTALQSFMSGFHQAGYAYGLQNALKETIPAYALQNALKEGAIDSQDPTRFKPIIDTRFDITYNADDPKVIKLKETASVIMVTDLHDPKQQEATSTYEKSTPSEKRKYKPIATATATYTFSDNKTPTLTNTNITTHFENDNTYKMRRHIPDDRTLFQKLKDLFENFFNKKEKTKQRPTR